MKNHEIICGICKEKKEYHYCFDYLLEIKNKEYKMGDYTHILLCKDCYKLFYNKLKKNYKKYCALCFNIFENEHINVKFDFSDHAHICEKCFNKIIKDTHNEVQLKDTLEL